MNDYELTLIQGLEKVVGTARWRVTDGEELEQLIRAANMSKGDNIRMYEGDAEEWRVIVVFNSRVQIGVALSHFRGIPLIVKLTPELAELAVLAVLSQS